MELTLRCKKSAFRLPLNLCYEVNYLLIAMRAIPIPKLKIITRAHLNHH